jgi:hypothetical protein
VLVAFSKCDPLHKEHSFNPEKIESHLFKNIPAVFSATDTAESKTLPLLKKGFVNLAIMGALSNRAAGYVISYLNTMVNVTQVGFRRNDETAEVLFVVEKDLSMQSKKICPCTWINTERRSRGSSVTLITTSWSA